MSEMDLRLNCTRCHSFTEYERRRDDNPSIIYCEDCGKKHSTDSVHFVEINRQYDRDEAGNLLEDTP